MPAMGLEQGRRGMVSGDYDNVWIQFDQTSDGGINLLNNFDLPREIAVLASAVRSFHMEKEEVEIGVVLSQRLEFIVNGSACGENIHADQLGQAAVHRIAGD